MPINVKSWEKLSNDQVVPLCKPMVLAEDKEISTESNERNLRENGYFSTLVATLYLSWEYFVAGYRCYCLSKKAWRSDRDYLLSLEKFQFSFKDPKNPEHKIQIFQLHTDREIDLMAPGHDYVCDRTGFALIYYSDEILQLYYYDFRRKFTTYINIPFRLNKYYSVKLYSRTLWILNRKPRNKVEYNIPLDTKNDLAYFQALIIKDSNIWSSVQSKIKPDHLMVDHVKSNSSLVCVNDLSLGLLNINLNYLTPNFPNYVPIDEAPDPTEFTVLKTRLAEGSCRTAIVDLSEKSKVLCIYFPEGTLNFLYFESDQLISVKRLELGQRLYKSSMSEVTCYFISELAIMVVPTIKRMLFIINLKECKVTRIFDLEIPYDDWFFLFNCSKNFQKLTVACYVPPNHYSLPHVMINKRKIVLVFDLCNALLPLKKLAIGLIKKHCRIDDIEKLNLPQSLKKEILDEMVY